VALGSLWQSLCDADTFLQVNPTTSELVKSIPAQGHGFLVAAGGRLVTSGPEGLAALDPVTGAFAPLPGGVGTGGQLLASDGDTIWMLVGGETRRIDPVDGHTVATFPYDAADAVTFANGHAWLTQGGIRVVDIDLATNSVVQVIPVFGAQSIARESGGIVWVTSFDAEAIWRIQP
jgi:streptogramin lyase